MKNYDLKDMKKAVGNNENKVCVNMTRCLKSLGTDELKLNSNWSQWKEKFLIFISHHLQITLVILLWIQSSSQQSDNDEKVLL